MHSKKLWLLKREKFNSKTVNLSIPAMLLTSWIAVPQKIGGGGFPTIPHRHILMKSVEAAAELSAKDLKEKKDKVEEKAGRKERKKEVVEEEENGAEEEEEETAEDGEDDDEGDEEDEEEEEEDEGPVRKRTAEEEDEADPKRQKTENGASA